VSKRNNQNPDHYKVAGREHPGHQVVKAPKQPQAMERGGQRPGWERQTKKKGK
jgi:hypothetical protein